MQVVVTTVVSAVQDILYGTKNQKVPSSRQLRHTNYALSGDL